MKQGETNGRISVTCCYDENGEDVKDLLANSFALFLANEAEKRYHVTNGWLPVGGTTCTQE